MLGPIATAKSNAFQLVGGGRRRPGCRMAERPQPTAHAIVFTMTLGHPTPSSVLPNEAHPPRGRFLVASNLENRDHICPGHENLKTFVPSPRAIPASIRSGKEFRRVAEFSKRTRHRKLGAPARWPRYRSSNRGSMEISQTRERQSRALPVQFPHPHIPSLSAAAHRSLRQATSPGWRLNGRCRHPEAEVEAAAYLNSLGKALGRVRHALPWGAEPSRVRQRVDHPGSRCRWRDPGPFRDRLGGLLRYYHRAA